MSKILSRDQNFSHYLDLLDQTLINIDEIQTILNNIVLDNDIEQQIISIEDRLFEIRTLAKKHNIEVHKIPIFLETSIKKLEDLNQEIFDEKNLIIKQDELFQIYQNSCALISKKRQEVAQILENKINKELSDLISKSASFKVSINQLDILNGTSSGIDQVRFTVSTNAGMPHMPIDQVASGGELSRIMLAIKSVMFEMMAKSTIIFDEIDTGVGGAIADIIGEKLRYLSQNAQIITITHQPQIASKSNQHLLVFKTEEHGQTFCHIKELDMNQKIKEIARMLSGKNITSKTTDAAKEMIGIE